MKNPRPIGGDMRYLSIVMVLFILGLPGCATEYAPIYTAGVNAAGENIATVSGLVKDASTSKESMVHTTLQTMYKEYTKAHMQSGLTVEFELMELYPGVKAYLPKKVEYRDEPEYDTLVKAPTEPSKHPVWHTVDNVVNKGLWLGLGWVFADTIKDMNSGTHYENVNMNNSQNSSGGGQQLFNIDSQLYETPASEGVECWMPDDPTCSCESRAAGNC